VRYSVMYDDNVLGLSSNISAPSTFGLDSRSDFSRTLEVGALFDETIGRQHITGNFKASKTKYDTYRSLDFDGRDLAANWNWLLGNQLGGNLGVNYGKGMTPFTDFHQLAKNTRTQSREYFDAAWRFLARNGSSVGLLLVHTNGNYPNRSQLDAVALGNSYKQDEVKANIDWRVSGKTRLQLLAGQVSRTHEELQTRDYKGFNARLAAEWLVSGKLAATTAIWREIGVVDDLSAVYSLNKGVSFTPRWQLSEKTQLQMQIKYEQRDFTKSLASTSTPQVLLKDVLRSASLVVAYKPLRNTTIQASIFHATKSSEQLFNGYSRNGVSISVQQQL